MTCKDADGRVPGRHAGSEVARELRTAELGRDAGRIEMPAEMKRHLREFLATQLGSNPA